jgi:hypothetical protein
MDPTEKHVNAHLVHRGFTLIAYEPDGNVPPDFLIDGRIAVEVRRLNQNHFSASDAKGLEEVACPLWDRIKQLLASLGPPRRGESWFVYYRFSRPIETWKTLEPKIRNGLQAFISDSDHSKRIIAKSQGIELEVLSRTPKPHDSMFVVLGCTDQESGGWLLEKMDANIRYCASEKSRKIEKIKPNYPQWWLALVDHIGYGLDDLDYEMLRDQVSVEHSWDKVLIIDPRDHKRWFEI